jgi:crossover junction endodeoxyribonuclease RuvC
VTKNILCIDFGKSMGWAVCKGGSIFSGTEKLHGNRFSGGGMPFLKFRQWLDSLICKGDVYHSIYFEEVRRHLGVDAAHVYGGFLATLTSWCEDQEIPYLGVSVATIKKHATGKGNAKKPEIIAAMQGKGFNPQDDNEADALALLHWALDHEKA